MASQAHEECIEAVRELVFQYLQKATQDRNLDVATFARQIAKTGSTLIHSRQRSQSYQPSSPEAAFPSDQTFSYELRPAAPRQSGAEDVSSPSDTEHLGDTSKVGYSPDSSWKHCDAVNPGVVVEVANTETTEHLMVKADRYIRAYDVKVVVCLFLAHRSEDTQEKASSVVLKVWTIDDEITSQGGRVPKLIVNKACVPGHLHNNG